MARTDVGGARTKRATRREGFKVPGTFLNFDGGFDVELENRLTRANRAFFASWDLLGCTSIQLEKDCRYSGRWWNRQSSGAQDPGTLPVSSIVVYVPCKGALFERC